MRHGTAVASIKTCARRACRGRLGNYLDRALIDRQRTSVRLRMFLRKRGGARRVAEGDADRLVQILYEKIRRRARSAVHRFILFAHE